MRETSFLLDDLGMLGEWVICDTEYGSMKE